MPWNAGDAQRFKKDITEEGKSRWAAIANQVLQQGKPEDQAIRIANSQTRSKRARGDKT